MTFRRKTDKPKQLSVRIPDDLLDAYEYILEVYPDGVTKWVVDCLSKVKPNKQLLEQLRTERQQLVDVNDTSDIVG